MPKGQGGDGCGIGTEDAGTEGDAVRLWHVRQAFSFRLGKPALGTDEDRPGAPGQGGESCLSLTRRLLIAEQKVTVGRPVLKRVLQA